MSTTAEKSVQTIKFLAVDAVEKAHSGHPGMPMGCADLAYVLFHDYLQATPDHASWKNRDRFILSAGHGSMLQYALLHLMGYDVSIQDLQSFRQLGSNTPGHPEFGHTHGVEATTGPLGQGTGNAVGMALAAKMMSATFATETFNPIDHHVYALVSDGDLMEGISSESASLAGHLGLSNLIYIYDDNDISIDGSTDLAFTEDIKKRFEAYGWFVQNIDGHNHTEIRAAIDKAKSQTNQPSIIIAKTHIAHGAPTKQDTAGSHGSPLGDQETKLAKESCGWPTETPFHVPSEVRDHFSAAKKRADQKYQSWQQDMATWKESHPEKYKTWQQYWQQGDLSIFKSLLSNLPAMPDATRNISHNLQQQVAQLIPNLVGGSADLACSCKTLIKDAAAISAADFGGRNVHFGIREHAMGAIANGMSLYGAHIPYTSTFLVFSDYMRPAIRMAALSNLQTVFIFTHDSIHVGEDGPTHQPIEHIPSLRMIPNLQVARPCNAHETAASWHWATNKQDGPTSIILSRQTLDDTPADSYQNILKGGYIFQDSPHPDVILIATGSEVPLACAAKTELEKSGKSVRVVSIPCLEIFEKQDASYIQEVLLPEVQKVAIEAAHGDLWYKWVGQEGIVIDIHTYGISAPGKQVAQHFGFTKEHIVECIDQA